MKVEAVGAVAVHVERAVGPTAGEQLEAEHALHAEVVMDPTGPARPALVVGQVGGQYGVLLGEYVDEWPLAQLLLLQVRRADDLVGRGERGDAFAAVQDRDPGMVATQDRFLGQDADPVQCRNLRRLVLQVAGDCGEAITGVLSSHDSQHSMGMKLTEPSSLNRSRRWMIRPCMTSG